MMRYSDLRAEVARLGIPLYCLALRVGIHPVTLGRLLRGKRPLTDELVERVMAAIREFNA